MKGQGRRKKDKLKRRIADWEAMKSSRDEGNGKYVLMNAKPTYGFFHKSGSNK